MTEKHIHQWDKNPDYGGFSCTKLSCLAWSSDKKTIYEYRGETF